MMVDLGTCFVRAEDVKIIHRCVDEIGNTTRGAKVVMANGEYLNLKIGADEVAARVNREPVFVPTCVPDATFFARES